MFEAIPYLEKILRSIDSTVILRSSYANQTISCDKIALDFLFQCSAHDLVFGGKDKEQLVHEIKRAINARIDEAVKELEGK